jgi:hypothetical protein
MNIFKNWGKKLITILSIWRRPMKRLTVVSAWTAVI